MVVGARSAVFAPIPELGLIVVDEEHEGAYKQDESPRYHGRDVAVMRAKLEGATVVLGSATPSLESHANALAGKYERLVLAQPRRPAGPAARRDRRPARGPEGRRRADPDASAGSRARRAARARRAVAAAPEPPRLRDEPAVPRVRAAGELSQLLGLAHGARRRRHQRVPLLRLPGAHGHGLRGLQGRVPAAHGLRHGEGRRGGARRAPQGARRAARSRPGATARGRGRDAARPSRRARSTSWSARR